MEDEREFVTDAIGDCDIGEVFDDLDGCSIHEVECALVVGLCETMTGGESVAWGGGRGG